ncbi:hypothetical protein [Croceibacter atlanticus]|uniref:HNH nuclease domain-containing protein n=1 Tax=Croceibacter atlanticus (strain ATCC BAA-628 / JCM 21780 / CIP 108009 / IAM 15332 / KCTC 12090 / HTCC2559) TaxID=216432 RepID=A3U4K6_CROAH|nr:hypothetical protein [Croceibacter atlanticus]EAP87173.1 hypothetical protein CA2559_00420 [Croceibacter atlanticus HTCC2559]
MAKQKKYGFRTPIRRTTKNITGNKVGGVLTGSEAEIKYSKKIIIDKTLTIHYKIPKELAVSLFNSNIGIAALGGYFLSSKDIKILFSLNVSGNESKIEYNLSANRYESIGHDLEVDLDEDFSVINASIVFECSERVSVNYTHFGIGFVNKDAYIESEEAYRHYSNSKKRICFPEQFYFDNYVEFDNSSEGSIILTKSCNRCQRFLPINPFNQRQQLAFSNHCTTKAPCTHKGFSIYNIVSNNISEDSLISFQKKLLDKGYSFEDGNLISYFGHQLECKACKKFFVNAALNHLRSSSQHREDSLRRRAFELLSCRLLDRKWIYHEFRKNTGKEFDKYIFDKFEKSCFKCGVAIKSSKKMHLDHTMPLSHLYPLDESATCLCASCNLAKSDMFPIDFYTENELERLSVLTSLPLELLKSRSPNELVITELKNKILWFIDDFLNHPEYIKLRDGKKAADSILHSVNKAVSKSSNPFNIINIYNEAKG